MKQLFKCGLVFSLAVFVAGCKEKDKPQPSQQTEFKNKKDDHDHSDHDKDHAKLEDAAFADGKKCHVALEAHLSKKGNHELEIGFETQEKQPKPVTLPENAKITGRVTREGDDMAYELVFKPSPKKERPTDPEGQCSHFEASAKWMKPEDKLTVTLNIEGVTRPVVFVDFNPKKYSHEAD